MNTKKHVKVTYVNLKLLWSDVHRMAFKTRDKYAFD